MGTIRLFDRTSWQEVKKPNAMKAIDRLEKEVRAIIAASPDDEDGGPVRRTGKCHAVVQHDPGASGHDLNHPNGRTTRRRGCRRRAWPALGNDQRLRGLREDDDPRPRGGARPRPGLAVAFNKLNASDLASRLPGNFTTKTMNGLGHLAWARALGGLAVSIDDRKIGKLVRRSRRTAASDLSTDLWDGLRRLATQAMQQGLVPVGSGPEGLGPDNAVGWGIVGDAEGLASDDVEFLRDLAREVLKPKHRPRPGRDHLVR